jgi:hypothetical protein
MGQSNLVVLASVDANNTFDPSGLGPLLPEMGTELASYLGLSGSAILYAAGTTALVGHGLYPNSSDNEANSTWLDNPNTISGGTANLPSQLSNPSTWVPPSQWTWGSPDGTTFERWVTGLSAQQRADVCSVLFIWHENDSARTYAEKAVWKAAWQRFIALVRAAFGVTTPALMPVFDCTPLPSLGNPGGHAMVYESVRELAADPANSLYVALYQTADCDPCAITGSAGQAFDGTYHTNFPSYDDYSTRSSFVMGYVLDTLVGISRIPAAMGTGAGPAITGASLSGNVVTVNITHDAGNALVLNGTASTGAGWSVIDQGGSPDIPGVQIPAIAVSAPSATTLAITLAWPPVSATAARLHYPWGNDRIGYGDAVTDNRASLTYAPGIAGAASTPGASLGTSMPIQRPITLNAGVATLGYPLATPFALPALPYGFNVQNQALPETGTFTHGTTETMTCAVDTYATAGYATPAKVRFGCSASRVTPPATWTTGTPNAGTSVYFASVPVPATAGVWFIWVEGLDSSGNTVSRQLSAVTIG